MGKRASATTIHPCLPPILRKTHPQSSTWRVGPHAHSTAEFSPPRGGWYSDQAYADRSQMSSPDYQARQPIARIREPMQRHILSAERTTAAPHGRNQQHHYTAVITRYRPPYLAWCIMMRHNRPNFNWRRGRRYRGLRRGLGRQRSVEDSHLDILRSVR